MTLLGWWKGMEKKKKKTSLEHTRGAGHKRINAAPYEFRGKKEDL